MRALSEITWPAEYSELKRIEELLVCGICYDYMDTSVMTPCSHNYCSLCIRKYLHYKSQCPACFQDTFEKDLQTNRILDEIILYFSKIRDKLVNCITGARKLSEHSSQIDTDAISPPVRPARSNHHVKSPEPISKAESPPSKPTPATTSPLKTFSSPSTSGSLRIATIFTPKARKTETKGKLVPCPICQVEISELHINKHLDDCLKRDSMPEPPPRVELKRKPLPKLVFSLMKDAELKKKMKVLNLSIRGDRKTLENRYHRYCTLYNAECDKVAPRTAEELLKQCELEEELERLSQEAKRGIPKLNITRNTDANKIEAVQKEYLASNKDTFDSLIQQVKRREKPPKPPARRSLSEDYQNVVTSPEDEESWAGRPMFDSAFQDNDSNDGCLLQTYTSDHPMGFLSLEMSEDSSSPKKPQKPETQNTEPNASVFDETTDAETDSDHAGNEEAKATKKRPKLNPDESTKINEERASKARSLAQSIAQDFLDDCSDDGSVKNEKNESRTSDLSKIDKENNEAVSDSIAARRPLRKRNHPSRFSSQDTTGGSRGSQPTRLVPIEALREEINGNKAPLSPKSNDGAMKRRRRRKCVSPSSDEQTPPTRPVRKRNSTAVLQDSAN